jgi:hypothetical protein
MNRLAVNGSWGFISVDAIDLGSEWVRVSYLALILSKVRRWSTITAHMQYSERRQGLHSTLNKVLNKEIVIAQASEFLECV